MSQNLAKIAVWTVALVVVLGIAVYKRFDWLVLMIPGAVLMWYGLIQNARHGGQVRPGHKWSSLH